MLRIELLRLKLLPEVSRGKLLLELERGRLLLESERGRLLLEELYDKPLEPEGVPDMVV
jgi:hypothetical protein